MSAPPPGSVSQTAAGSRIALVLLDIDGVLTEGEGKPLDLDLLATLAGMNRRARADPRLPAVTLCSGRPAPYVEVLQQGIDGHLPAIFENGAGLYVPQPYGFLAHPSLHGVDHLPKVRAALERGLIDRGLAFIQPGKIYSLTLFATDPSQTPLLRAWTVEALGPLANEVQLVYSTSCLNVLPPGVDKGKGASFLSQHTGIPLQAMLAVGDSDVDLPLLDAVGHSAAPSNAEAGVRNSADFVADRPTADAVRDILTHYGLLQ
ncbi:MAG: HAD family hydrolase [Anaerolineales bacterium]